MLLAVRLDGNAWKRLDEQRYLDEYDILHDPQILK